MATLIVPHKSDAEARDDQVLQAGARDRRAGFARGMRVCLLVAVLLLAFWLRAFHLGKQSLWYDEAFSAFVVNRSWLSMAQFMASIVDNHPPLYYVVLHAFLVAGGGTEFTLRFASLVPGTLCIPFTLVLVRRVTSPWDRHGGAMAHWGAAALLVW